MTMRIWWPGDTLLMFSPVSYLVPVFLSIPTRYLIFSAMILLDYPVSQFGGTKSIVFSTVSFIGGRNPFLGIAYLVVAGICVLFGLLLTLRHLIKPRKLGDMRYLRCVRLHSILQTTSVLTSTFTMYSWNQPEKTKIK